MNSTRLEESKESKQTDSLSSTTVLLSSEVNKMKMEEPTVFSQMCVNLLKYLVSDMPTEEMSKLLEIKHFKNATSTSNTSYIQRKSFLNASKKSEKSVVQHGNTPFHKKGVKETKVETEENLPICHILIKYLENYTDKEGIFRIPGNKVRMDKLREDLKSRNLIAFAKKRYSHNDVSSVLKGLLKSPNTLLIPCSMQKTHIYISEITFDLEAKRKQRMKNWWDNEVQICDFMGASFCEEFLNAKNRHIEALQIVLAMLPQENFDILGNLMKLLHAIARKQNTNKMSAFNLATIFTPHILWPTPEQKREKCSTKESWLHDSEEHLEMMQKSSYAVTFMIRHCHRIFSPHTSLADNVSQYFKAKQLISQSKFLSSSTTITSSAAFLTPIASVNKHQHNRPQFATLLGIKRNIFNGSGVECNYREPTFSHLAPKAERCYKRRSPESSNSDESVQTLRSKRSNSLGAVIKKRMAGSSISSGFKNPNCDSNCAKQELYVQSELGGYICSSPAGIKTAATYHLLV